MGGPSCSPGASAETVEDTVAQVIEHKRTGLDRMCYLSATSDSTGNSRIEQKVARGELALPPDRS
jgi:HAE1 family hydrophobic/amphiphilic exporter-1